MLNAATSSSFAFFTLLQLNFNKLLFLSICWLVGCLVKSNICNQTWAELCQDQPRLGDNYFVEIRFKYARADPVDIRVDLKNVLEVH